MSTPYCPLAAGLVLLVMLNTCSAASPDEESLQAKARAIHQRVLTLDSHVDIAGPQYATAALDPGIDNPELRCDLVKMCQGGVDGAFLAVYVGQGSRDADGYRRARQSALAKFEAIHRLTEAMYPTRCKLATSPDDVSRIAATGKRAIMIGVENGYPLGTELANVEEFYRLGARYITLSHNGHNQICDSCNPRPGLGDKPSEHGGLSPFGRQVVAEMNRLGMIVDVSHIASTSFADVAETSRAPFIASHSGCRALHDHPRNLDDDQLRTLAGRGGVIQIVAVGSFLKVASPQRRDAIRELADRVGMPMAGDEPQWDKATPPQQRDFWQAMDQVNRDHPAATLSDFVDHLDHAVKVAGVDHVGIGTDFDGGAGIPDLENHRDAPNLTLELLRRDYTEDKIRKIWGGNLLRVWREVERTAAELQQGRK